MSTVPMFAPDGTLGDIPAEKLMAAKAAGFKQGVTMKTAEGKLGAIPADRVTAAAKSGLQIVPLQEQETQHPGFWASLGSDIKDMMKGAATAAATVLSSDPNDIAYRMNQQAQTAQQMSANDDARKAEGRGVPYRVGAAANEALGVNVKGEEQSAKEGDVMGVLGHASAVPVTMAATAGAGKAAPILSDAAKLSADALTSETAGKVGRTAMVGAKTAARFADVASFERLGKVANALKNGAGQIKEIWKTPEVSLDNIADALAQTIADDRARVAINKSKGLGELPATGAKSASQTGEALANPPTSGPEPAGGKVASVPRFTQADRAAAKSLLQDALKQHSGDIIDAAIPPSGTTRGANLFTRAQVDAALKSGDVAKAEKVLDTAAKRIDPSYVPNREIQQSLKESLKKLGGADDGTTNGPVSSNGHTWQYNGHFLKDGKILDKSSDIADAVAALSQKDYFGGKTIEGQVASSKPAPTSGTSSNYEAFGQRQGPVPTTAEIRARVQQQRFNPAERLQDQQIHEQLQEHFNRHGWAAEEEARREFIARNSTGVTKGGLTEAFRKSSGKSAPAPAPASDDLTDLLQKSLEQARGRRQAK